MHDSNRPTSSGFRSSFPELLLINFMSAVSFAHPNIVSRARWLAARRALLREEKALTRMHDKLAARRRRLPWVRIEKEYVFESPTGRVTLADLFAGRSQLLVQHFMFGPGWKEGCRSCSFMMDHFVGTLVHLAARDVSFAAISHASLAEILPFKERMAWNINWVSSHGTDFNFDFHVSFDPKVAASGRVFYNFVDQEVPNAEEMPGISVFARGGDGAIYHTYSTYFRGVELILATYQLLDIVPKGRDEEGMYGMEWLRHHDRYEGAAVELKPRPGSKGRSKRLRPR